MSIIIRFVGGIRTIMSVFRRSTGAVTVREMIPAVAPARKIFAPSLK